MSSLFYFLKESFQGLTRNLSTTLGSIITIFLSLLIIGVFLVGGVIVEHLVRNIENEVTITAHVGDEASQDSIDAVINQIMGLPDVASVSFTTKDQALEDFRETTINPDIIDQLDGQNPLPASIEVDLSDPSQVETVVQEILDSTDYKSITDNPDDPAEAIRYGQRTVDKLFTVTSYLRYIGAALILLLVFIALVFINNTIRLAIMARRKEIAIMRLVGASNGFIRGPFLMEGALHALIGSLLAVGVIEALRNFALPQVKNTLMWLPVDLPMETYLVIYAALIVAGLLIGLIGSALAMRRYLKV